MWRWVCSENRKKYVLWLGLTKKGKTVWKASPEGSTSQIPSLMGNCRWASGFPGGSVVKKPTYQCRSHRRREFDPWVGKIPGGGKGNRLQYSCLGNPMDRGVWWATVHRVTKSWTWLSFKYNNILKFIWKTKSLRIAKKFFSKEIGQTFMLKM